MDAHNNNNNNNRDDNVEEGAEENQLFAALRGDEPLEAIRSVVVANPALLRLRNRDGLLPLHSAIVLARRASVVRLFVNTWPEAVRERTNDGKESLPIHLACKMENGGSMREHVRVLVGAWPESLCEKDASESLPLHEAFERHFPSLAVVRRLVEAYPEALELGGFLRMLPLHLAVFAGSSVRFEPLPRPARVIRVVRYLIGQSPQALQAEAVGIGIPLVAAIKVHASVELVRELVRQSPQSVRTPSIDGCLPLHEAARFGTVVVARFLWEQWPGAADVATDDEWGKLPIHAAPEHGNVEVARFLAEQRPDHLREARTHEGMLPIHSAAQRGALQIVSFFADMAPDTVRATTAKGQLPIHVAAAMCRKDVVRFLILRWPESVRETTIHGRLPLHEAASESRLEDGVVEFLIEQWPDSVREPAVDGRLALHMAALHGNVRNAQTLVDHWPESPMVADHRGRLPIHLHCAEHCLGRSMDFVRYLVEQQPQCLGVRDQDGNLPLHLAVAREKDGILPLRLLEACNNYSLELALKDFISLELVEYLVERCPRSVRVRNAEGLLPIQIAAVNPVAPLDVVYALAAKWPECIKRPWLNY